MKWLYIIAMLFLFWSCSKDHRNECGLVGEWLCCGSASACITFWNGLEITETWTFEEDGDYFVDGFIPSFGKWNTDEDCTELVIDLSDSDEYKLKIDISGDELVVHYGSFVGDRTFCRQ